MNKKRLIDDKNIEARLGIYIQTYWYIYETRAVFWGTKYTEQPLDTTVIN